MPATVKLQSPGYSVQYPKTQWQVNYIEDAQGRFRFQLVGRDFKFEPRDRYRYPSHDDAKRAAFCFLELMKRLERSKMKLSVLAEIGILKFPQETYRSYQLWVAADRTRYTWEASTVGGLCLRSQRWYKHPDTAIKKAKAHIAKELAMSQIREVVGWV